MTITPDHRAPIGVDATRRLARNGPPNTGPVTSPATFAIRMAEVSTLRPDGSVATQVLKVPALPVFDAALSAFARGTVLQSAGGPIAIEDLMPGDRLITARGDASEVKWIGSSTFTPQELGSRMPLTRIMADSFGVNRPESFLTLGSAARILKTPPSLRSESAKTPLMTPTRRFLDGTNVIDVAPPTSVRLYHLSLHRHAAILAAGLEVETYHPGAEPTKTLSHTLQTVFMAMFPHVQALTDFGPLTYQRAPAERETA